MNIESSKAEEFAVQVVRRLRDAGFEALWAGGCVRDRLLGRPAQDYDVATNARPEQIRQLFGRRRTLAVGAAFGVIAVRGPLGAGLVEVATFRQDAQYSDGRHPDRVTFSTAEEDAQRRDFTINGIFYDPLGDEVIDYVNGQADLRAGIVRAIGDPFDRFSEDKLRMLRAVRFAATFDFVLDPATLAAIRAHPADITIVSAERIAAELRRMLVHQNRAQAVRFMADAGLLEVLLPEAEAWHVVVDELQPASEQTPWQRTLSILGLLDHPRFSVALAALLREIPALEPLSQQGVRTICQRWRLSKHDTESTAWLLAHLPTVRNARRIRWPALQPLLVAPGRDDLLLLGEAVANVIDGHTLDIEHCRAKLARPPGELDPPPLVTGDDLIQLGIPRGKSYQTLLQAIRDAQLEKQIGSKQAGLELAKRLWDQTRET